MFYCVCHECAVSRSGILVPFPVFRRTRFQNAQTPRIQRIQIRALLFKNLIVKPGAPQSASAPLRPHSPSKDTSTALEGDTLLVDHGPGAKETRGYFCPATILVKILANDAKQSYEKTLRAVVPWLVRRVLQGYYWMQHCPAPREY